MKALKYLDQWKVNLTETKELHCIEADDVIVNIQVCGICGTDVGIITGDYPVAHPGVTLGHETAGVVTQVGNDVRDFKVGDRVVINPTYSCQKCRMCQIGNFNHCETKVGTEAGVSYDGAFAEQYCAKEKFLIKIDDHVSFAAASLTEPLSCTITGVDKLSITHTNVRAAVIGAGPMGMLYLWVLHHRGVNAFMVEKNQYRYDFARRNLPPAASIYQDFEEAMQAEYPEQDAYIDLVVDTTGYLTEVVCEHLAPGGKLLNIALKDKKATIDVLKIVDKSLSIMGSIDSLNNSFERAYAMIRDGHIPAERLISHEFPISEYEKAFQIVGCDINQQKLTPPQNPNCKVLLRIAEVG